MPRRLRRDALLLFPEEGSGLDEPAHIMLAAVAAMSS